MNESSKKLTKIDKSRILAIGDSLHHDIKGAINFGIDSLLITSTGIHQKYFDKQNLRWDTDTNNLKNLVFSQLLFVQISFFNISFLTKKN